MDHGNCKALFLHQLESWPFKLQECWMTSSILKANITFLPCTVESICTLKPLNSERVLISLSELQEESWTIWTEVTWTSKVFKLSFLMKLILCSTWDSKRMLMHFLRLWRRTAEKRHNSCCSQPLSLLGLWLCAKTISTQPGKWLISLKILKVKHKRISTISLSVALTTIECRL